MNNALALKYNAPAVFGSNEEMNSIVERMAVLMPTRLADWQLKPGYIEKAEKNLTNAFYKTAQLAIFYRLVPSQDIHILPFGNDFVVDMGIEAWRKSADRYCSLHQITYHVHTEEMSLDELKKRRGKNYDPDDVGAVAYLWRSDKEKVYQIFGAKESMSRACGVWAKKAKEVNGKPIEDTIPAQRTKDDVAKRRAIKAVLKLEFSLDSLLAATPAEISQNVRYLDQDIRHEEMRQAVPNSRRVEVDDDGFVIVEPSKPRVTVDDVQFVVAEEEEDMEDGPDFDSLFEDDTDGADDDSVDYRALAATLTGREASFVGWAKQSHADGRGGAASPQQYRYLTGVLDKITGDKRGHTLILSTLIGRHVDSANPPGTHLCGRLLEWLRPEVTDEVTGEKVANPTFRQDYMDSIMAMWQTLQTTASGSVTN